MVCVYVYFNNFEVLGMYQYATENFWSNKYILWNFWGNAAQLWPF